MFSKILLPLDVHASEAAFSQQALDVALALAAQSNGTLYLMDVLPDYGMPVVAAYFPPEARAAARAETEQKLRDFIARQIPASVRVQAVLREGSPYEEILAEAEQLGVDLIVIPSQRLGSAQGFLLGSTAAKVVRHAHCTVMVIREHGHAPS